jgi:hypothetical protein
MASKNIAFLLCRLMAIYCLLSAIGVSQTYFQSLAAIFNMEAYLGVKRTLWGIIIGAVPVALYIIGWAILWWRAKEIAEKMTGPFPDDLSEANSSRTISSSFAIGLIGLYVIVSCAPQLIYFVFSFFESYQTTIKGRIFSSIGQIICSFLQIMAGAILIWRAREIAKSLSPAE